MAVLESTEVFVAFLRSLRVPAATTLANTLASAERLRRPVSYTETEKQEVNSRGYTLAQCRVGSHTSAINRNRDALNKHAQALVPIFVAREWHGSLPQLYAAVALYGVNIGPLKAIADRNPKAAADRAEEERLWQGYYQHGKDWLYANTSPA